jgi:hypothetical protein
LSHRSTQINTDIPNHLRSSVPICGQFQTIFPCHRNASLKSCTDFPIHHTTPLKSHAQHWYPKLFRPLPAPGSRLAAPTAVGCGLRLVARRRSRRMCFDRHGRSRKDSGGRPLSKRAAGSQAGPGSRRRKSANAINLRHRRQTLSIAIRRSPLRQHRRSLDPAYLAGSFAYEAWTDSHEHIPCGVCHRTNQWTSD